MTGIFFDKSGKRLPDIQVFTPAPPFWHIPEPDDTGFKIRTFRQSGGWRISNGMLMPVYSEAAK